MLFEESTPYAIYVYVKQKKIIISLDALTVSRIEDESYIISFENFDESISILEGLRYDLSEVIEYSSDRMLTIKHNEPIRKFIETKLEMMTWKDIPEIIYMDGSKKISAVEPVIVDVFQENEYLTAREVLKKLRISDQTLAKWRKNGQIKCKQLSARKYLYHVDDVRAILNNGTGITKVVDKSNTTKVVKKSNKTIVDTNYEAEILKLLHQFVYKVPDYKYKKQNFFLNFGNIGISSSPQVMINNDFQLVDYIKKQVIYDGPEELFGYLSGILDEGKSPGVDSSKIVQNGYSMFYLNNLRKQYK